MRFYSSLFCALALLLLSLPMSSSAQTATINAGTVYQTIDGFGAATMDYTTRFTAADAQLFFSTTPGVGVGLSLLRSEVPYDGSCSSINSTCAGAEIADLQLANSYGVKIWSMSISPPASMKTNGSLICNTGSGNGSLSSGSYGAFATYLSNYVASVKAQGVNLYGVSVQNEPDYCPTTYQGATWSAQNLHDFILNNLGPTLAANGSGVKIIMPESESWGDFTNMAGTTMNDPSAAAYVGVNAFHGYDNSTSISYPYSLSHLWETEVSAFPGAGPSLCGGCWDPSMADAILWAQVVHYNLVSGHENAWHYWLLMDNVTTDNQGLIGGPSSTPRKFLYALGNWSLFVRPGMVMIGATNTPQSGVYLSAFLNQSTGAFAIVVINTNSSSVSQPFSLSGLSASSVTPYITDANNNLVSQPALTVSSNSFTASLNAASVTTFVGSGKAPAAPTNLTGTVIQ